MALAPRIALTLTISWTALGQGACGCDPPAVGSPDGGAELRDTTTPLDDGGVGVGDGDGGGFTLTGEVWLQDEDGMLARATLDDGSVSYPLGEASALGAVGAVGDEVLFNSPSGREDNFQGRASLYDPATGDVQMHGLLNTRPLDLESDGTQVGASFSVAGTVFQLGALTDNEIPDESTLSGVSALVYDDTGLIVSAQASDFTKRYDGTPLSGRQCGGLAVRPSDGEVLCADVEGSAIVVVDAPGMETVVDATGGARYLSLYLFADDTWAAPREDCTVHTSHAWLPTAPSVCVASFVEVGGVIYAGLMDGGLVTMAQDGTTTVVMSGAAFPDGIDHDGERLLVMGEFAVENGLVMDDDFTAPHAVTGVRGVTGGALGDDGEVWIADSRGLYYAAPGEDAAERVAQLPGLSDLQRVGRWIYVVSDGALKRVSLDGAPTDAPEDVTAAVDGRIGRCGDELLVYDGDDDEIRRVSATDGTETLEAVGFEATFGEPTALTCVADQLIVASGTAVYGRPLGDERAFKLAFELARDVRQLTPVE
jgi:hypothetical protein